MDGEADYSFTWDSADLDTGSLHALIIVAILLGGIWCCCRCCCCCSPCCQKAEPQNENNQATVSATIDQLEPKKRVLTSYIFLFTTGLFGGHHFYLGRWLHGLLAMWTMNFVTVGWWFDLFLVPTYTSNFNKSKCAAVVPYDTSLLSLRKVPIAFVLTSVGLLILGKFTPRVLHLGGILDLDQIKAQTATNPYQVLGISKRATPSEAKAAFRKLSLKWHPDRNPNCGQECNDKMAEITKAYDHVKKHRDDSHSTDDWKAMFEYFAQGDDAREQTRKREDL